MASAYAVFLLLSFFEIVGAQQANLVSLGNSLSPTNQPTSWGSPSGRFAFGFYQQGSNFVVGIWLVSKTDKVVVWTANRDDPPVSSNATLSLAASGNLLLRTDQGEEKLIANTNDSAAYAAMLDSGNFVLHNNASHVIWESFNFPTDTILSSQNLFTGSELVSRASKTNFSTGKFRLKMQYDGNLVLYPVNTQDTRIDAYWSTKTYGTHNYYHLYLNHTGDLVLINNTNLASISTLFYRSPLYNNSILYRATLDSDGIFRLYSHIFSSKGEYDTTTMWFKPDNYCLVKSFCGLNTYCTLNDVQPVCRCLPGTDFVDPNDESRGCDRNYTKELCQGGKEKVALYNYSATENLIWDDLPYSKEKMSKEDCSKSCMEDCNCDAAFSELEGSCRFCKKFRFPLKYAKRDLTLKFDAFFKVGTRRIKSNYSSSTEPPPIYTTSKKAIVLILFVTVGFITYSCATLIVSGFFIFKLRVLEYKRLLETGNWGLSQELTLRSFSYSELRKATGGFKEELGKGSFGTVYRGTLYKGKKIIAVKRLEKLVTEGEREFHAEMRVIGRTHHKNLVRLLGYCAEDSKRLLVYEYMSNGSLADLLFRAEVRPYWNERVRIALDVARGILYLHEECEAPIIHCDIKPQNILMDDFWTAKISDFGLAKLLMPDQTRTFTMVRGTRGYLAPEWQKNTPISVKADIYSYGIVLLEIICCRRKLDVNEPRPEAILLSSWVYKCFVARDLGKLVIGEVDKKMFENMVKIGLWCIQDEPAFRPSMKSVVLMLEGITDVAIPPCPTDSSV